MSSDSDTNNSTLPTGPPAHAVPAHQRETSDASISSIDTSALKDGNVAATGKLELDTVSSTPTSAESTSAGAGAGVGVDADARARPSSNGSLNSRSVNLAVITDEDALDALPDNSRLPEGSKVPTLAHSSKWPGSSASDVDAMKMARLRYGKFLEKSRVFNSLNVAGQLHVLANIKEKGFRRNDVLVKQGESAQSMYIIMQGEVSVHLQKKMTSPRMEGLIRSGTLSKYPTAPGGDSPATSVAVAVGNGSTSSPLSTPTSTPRGEGNGGSGAYTPRGTPRTPRTPRSAGVKPSLNSRRSRMSSIDVLDTANPGGVVREHYGHIARTYCPGEIFGESSLVREDATRAATVIALSDVVRCLVVDKATVVLAMLEHPEGIPLSPDGLPQAVATLKEDAHDIPAAAREVDPKRLEEIEDRIAAYFGDSSIDDAFNVIDGDGNQYLDYMEFKRLILDKARMQLTDAEFVRLMNVYDENQDGVISLTEFKLKYRINRKEFLQFVELKEDEADRFGSLPAIMLFFIVYVVLCGFRENTGAMFQLTKFLQSQFHDTATYTSGVTYAEVNSLPLLVEWVDEVMLPAAFTLDAPWQEAPTNTYSVLLASGVRLGLERSVDAACEGIDIWQNHTCFPQLDFSSEVFGLPLCNSSEAAGIIDTVTPGTFPAADCYARPRPGFDEVVNLTQSPNAGFESQSGNSWGTGSGADNSSMYMFDLDLSAENQTHVYERFHYLVDRGWFDAHTSFVTIQFFLLNGELGLFNQVDFLFEVTRAGSVQPRLPSCFQAISVDPYSDPVLGTIAYLLEAVWVVMIVSLVVSEVGEMREFCQERSPRRRCCDAYCSGYWSGTAGLWNMIDWAQVVITLANTGYWLFIVTSTRSVLTRAVDPLTGNFSSFHAVGDEITSAIELVYTYRILAFLNLYILLMRFFKSFLGQPKLALVTRTFKNVGADFAHWLIVFVCLLICFTFAGMFWFGKGTLQFSSVLYTFTGEMNTLARGFVIWLDVAGSNEGSFWIAFTWWFFFMFVMYLIILNVLVVLVVEIFEKTKRQMRSKTTLCAQVSQIIALKRLSDEGGITLSDIKDAIEPSNDEQPPPDGGCCYTCCLGSDDDDDDDDGTADGTVPLSQRPSLTVSNIFDSFWRKKFPPLPKGKEASISEEEEAKRRHVTNISWDYLVMLLDEFFVFRRLNNPTAEADNEKFTWDVVNGMDEKFADLRRQLSKLNTVLDEIESNSSLWATRHNSRRSTSSSVAASTRSLSSTNTANEATQS